MIDIVEAAECALRLALTNQAFLHNTDIPLIVHQTSRSADPKTWSSLVRKCIEVWLTVAAGFGQSSDVEMAWFMWDDDGVNSLIRKYENDFYPAFSSLPYPVEKADAFRVLVLKWFGGVVSTDFKGAPLRLPLAYSQQYGDIDSKPLKHPFNWVQASDLDDWYDDTGNRHMPHRPSHPTDASHRESPSSATSESIKKDVSKKTVNAIFGIESDNLPEPDDSYWRMGYTFPVQLTNWAMAMAPHHGIADQFLSDLIARIQADVNKLPHIDPLNITGPPALTQVIKEYAESAEPGFIWQSLSSRGSRPPGGRSKVIAGDVLILPITGFSPGRGRFRNMGSQSTTHPSARLQHMAAGSWRKPDLRVHYGKFCRTAFGLCREWSKIAEP